MKSQADWEAVKRAFATRHADMAKGNLLTALRSNLSANDQEELATVGWGNGVDIWGAIHRLRGYIAICALNVIFEYS